MSGYDGRGEPGGTDRGDLARRIRSFAYDAHRILTRPDSTLDEVLGLHRTVWRLLREVPDAHSGGMYRWLLAAKRAIGARLRAWSLDDLEAMVA
jgi:hypothetical protein